MVREEERKKRVEKVERGTKSEWERERERERNFVEPSDKLTNVSNE